MNEADHCPIDSKSDLPWAIPLPEADIITAGQLWAAILDPECRTKGRMISVLRAYMSRTGAFGNECPQAVRDRLDKMCL